MLDRVLIHGEATWSKDLLLLVQRHGYREESYLLDGHLRSGRREMTASDDPIVFILDDQRSVREAIIGLLDSVGLRAETFKAPQDFVSRGRPEGPSCLVLDVRLPGLSGLELQQQLHKSGDRIPIIFITGHGDVPMSVEAMKAGAVEFLVKPFRDQQLLDAIQCALARDRGERQRGARRAELQRRYDSLTPREREIMTYVVTGLMNKQIAAKLLTSVVTVKVHRARMMHKMNVTSIAELVRCADALASPDRFTTPIPTSN